MEAWILIALYVVLLVVLQFLIYRYLRADGGPMLGGAGILDGSPHEEADLYNGTTPPRDGPRAAEAHGDSGGTGIRLCPHCGSPNGRTYTYCWNCVGLVGR